MPEPTFHTLAEEAAAGLKADRELYLDVTEELTSHLEAKAEAFARQGHDGDEAADLARKAFGSPLDVAAELVEANRRRMRWRALFRLAFGAVMVPLAVVLAVYVGYGRFAQLYGLGERMGIAETDGPLGDLKLPLPPGLGTEKDPWAGAPADVRRAGREGATSDDLLAYYEANKGQNGASLHYAYYAAMLARETRPEGASAEEVRAYIAAMRHGETLEPDNALYPLLLAHLHLRRGMLSRDQKVVARGERPSGEQFAPARRPPGTPPRAIPTPELAETDELRDAAEFELGLAALRRAAARPYLRGYCLDVMRRHLRTLPPPVLIDDYYARLNVAASQPFPTYPIYKDLARMLPGCARLLVRQGRAAEAEALLDTWRPLTAGMVGDADGVLIGQLVAVACAKLMSGEAAEAYDALGLPAKAAAARASHTALSGELKRFENTKGGDSNQVLVLRYGPVTTGDAYWNMAYSVTPLTVADVTPGRMAEHALFEQIFVNGLLVLLTLVLLLKLLFSLIAHLRLRRSAAVPLLLLPPAREVARILLLGVVLPVAGFWLYTRLPVIGGREYGWASAMGVRFGLEMVAATMLVAWLCARMTRGFVRRRFVEVGIPTPPWREEARIHAWVYGSAAALLVLPRVLADLAVRTGLSEGLTSWHLSQTMTNLFAGDLLGLILAVLGTLIGIGLLVLGVVLVVRVSKRALRIRREHGLYLGTVARTMALMLALTIMFLGLAVQPFLMWQEATWLRRDRAIWGFVSGADPDCQSFTELEARSARLWRDWTLEAIATPPTESR